MESTNSEIIVVMAKITKVFNSCENVNQMPMATEYAFLFIDKAFPVKSYIGGNQLMRNSKISIDLYKWVSDIVVEKSFKRLGVK